VFVSHHEKLEKTFEVFSQVLDNFVAKVCRTSFLIHFFLRSDLAIDFKKNAFLKILLLQIFFCSVLCLKIEIVCLLT